MMRIFSFVGAMLTCTEHAKLSLGSLGHPSEGLQLTAELVSIFFSCEKLFFTQLYQSLLQHLHPCTLESSNLRGKEHVTSIHAAVEVDVTGDI